MKTRRHWPTELFLLSATTRTELIGTVRLFRDRLKGSASISFKDLSYTLSRTVKSKAGARLGLVARNLDDLIEKLNSTLSVLENSSAKVHQHPSGIYFSQRPVPARPQIAFVFPGQGSQYVHMASDLCLAFPEVREVFDRFDGYLEKKFEQPLSRSIFPRESFSAEEKNRHVRVLTDTHVAQASLGAVSVALLTLLNRVGLRPYMTAGHSYGEIPALHAAGVLSEKSLARISEARGRFIMESIGPETGTMAAVKAPADKVKPVIDHVEGVWIANLNAPSQTVISGTRVGVAAAMAQLEKQGITSVSIPVACAFHSPLVKGAQAKLKGFLSRIDISGPQVTVFSNTTAAPFSTQPNDIRQLLVEQLVRPVRFVQVIEAMYTAGTRYFIEVGAGNVLTHLIGQILGQRPHHAVCTNKKGGASLARFQHALAELSVLGLDLDLNYLYAHRQCKQLDIKHIDEGNMEKFTQPPPMHSSDNLEDPVMTRFLSLMSQFLDTQKAVMTAYLKGGGSLARSTAAMAQDAFFSQPDWMPDSAPGPTDAPPDSILFGLPEDRSPDPAPAMTSARAYEQDQWDDPAWTTAEGIEDHIPPVRPLQPSEGPASCADLDIPSMVLRVVSDRTGYPEDMLDLSQQIEPDLGIDSIKRIQIMETLLTELETAGVNVPGDQITNMADSLTLGDVVGKLNACICIAGDRRQDEAEPSVVTVEPEARGMDLPVQVDFIPDEEIAALLYRIIEENTGFPQENMAPGLQWDNDLNIDQVSQSLILEKLVIAVELATGRSLAADLLSGVQTHTLEEAIRWISDAAKPADEQGFGDARALPTMASVEPGSSVRDRPIRRFRLTTRERPLWAEPGIDFTGRTVLVTRTGNHPVAAAVIAELEANGIQPVILTHRDGPLHMGDRTCDLDLTSFKSLTEAVDRIRQQFGPVAGLLHLAPLTIESLPLASMALSQWRQRLALEVKSLFHLTTLTADDLARAAEAGRAALVAVTSMGGTFGSIDSKETGSEFFPGSGGITGFLKTAAEEFPGLNVRTVDIDPAAPEHAACGRQIVTEFLTPCADVEVGYHAGRRIMLDLQEAAIGSLEHKQMTIDSSSKILVTGGARGITAAVALALAREYKPTLFLVGRTPLAPSHDLKIGKSDDPNQIKAALARQLKTQREKIKPRDIENAYKQLIRQCEIKENIERLEAAGAQVHYFQADVTHEKAFGRVIDTIYEAHGGIDGVIHGAGLIEDKMIRDKNPNSFSRVFDTKADSLFILSRKLKPDGVRFWALFSSVAGRFGNPGQADYGAANEVYNKTARYLSKRWPGRVVSLIWGPWESKGMVSDHVRNKLDAQGIYLIPRRVGTQCFLEEVRQGGTDDAEVVFGGWDDRKKVLFAAMKADQLPLFLHNGSFLHPSGRPAVVHDARVGG